MAIGAVSNDNNIGAAAGAAASTPPAAQGAEFSETLNTASGSGKYDLDAIFEAASRKYNISVDLLKAVARAESNFRPDATSRCGAMGVMQLMPGTAKALGVTDAYDPEQNIMGGADYLRQMLDKFNGDVSLALAAYNAGPGAVTKYGGIPPYNETQNYVKIVLGYLGDGEVTAGSVFYGGLSDPGGARLLSNKPYETSAASALTASISQMLLMRIIEMQMSSSDDDKKPKVF